jgi:phosphopantothenoylcysteine synthetase/decarboxylase
MPDRGFGDGTEPRAAGQGRPASGFDADENSLLLIDHEGTKELPLAPKPKIARELVHEIALRLKARADRLRHQA